MNDASSKKGKIGKEGRWRYCYGNKGGDVGKGNNKRNKEERTDCEKDRERKEKMEDSRSIHWKERDGENITETREINES